MSDAEKGSKLILLLQKFIHENEDIERLERIADRFNIFTTLNIINTEIRHSDVLAWLLDPRENHGLNDYVLRAFLKCVAVTARETGREMMSVFDLDACDLRDAEVFREWPKKYGRDREIELDEEEMRKKIDILLKCKSANLICVIENKVGSGESENQLKTYMEVVEKEFHGPEKIYVYLTVEKDDPSIPEYIPMGYKEVLDILNRVIDNKKDVLDEAALMFISHYKEMLLRYIIKDSDIQIKCKDIYEKHKEALDEIFSARNREMSEKDVKELPMTDKICRQIYRSHKDVLDLINENKPDLRTKIHDCILKELQGNSNITLLLDKSTTQYISFISKKLEYNIEKNHSWKGLGKMLLFQVGNNLNGVWVQLFMWGGPKEVRERMWALAKENHYIFNCAKAKRQLSEEHMTLLWKVFIKRDVVDKLEWEEVEQKIEEGLRTFINTDIKEIVSVLGNVPISGGSYG